jgi:regulator of sigma E protease
MSIIIFLIILLVLVLVHEAGHFFAAKKFGIRVDEFGFGFPPKLFGIKKGETEYTFNLIPLGGFVKIYGEDAEEIEIPEASQTSPEQVGLPKEVRLVSSASNKFTDKPKYQQAIVIFAGVLMNFVLAWVLFSFSFIYGLPMSVEAISSDKKLENINLFIVSVLPNSPAEIAGLKVSDKIISVKSFDESISEINPETFKNFIVSHSDKEIEINYLRGKEEGAKGTWVKLKTNEDMVIGVVTDQIGILKLPIFQALKEGLNMTFVTAKGITVGLYKLIADGVRGRGSMESITGPVGIVKVVGHAYEFGFSYLISFMALISVNLAVINLVPFPALDGGRLLFLLIEKIKGSPINSKIANNANALGFVILLSLMLFVTYNDIARLFL